jgi:hypothetical protein
MYFINRYSIIMHFIIMISFFDFRLLDKNKNKNKLIKNEYTHA